MATATNITAHDLWRAHDRGIYYGWTDLEECGHERETNGSIYSSVPQLREAFMVGYRAGAEEYRDGNPCSSQW